MKFRLSRILPVVACGLWVFGAGVGTAWAQCPGGAVALNPDRDNTLYENASGTLSNGAGIWMFAGRTNQGSDEIRRALVHFDVAASVDPGATIVNAILQLNLSQPLNNGMRSIEIHTVTADWGEGTSQGGMGEGGGGAATTDDATWVNTFFDTTDWTTPGGDFDAAVLAATVVDSGIAGAYIWRSPAMAAGAQAWLDSPSTNFGWVLTGDETESRTALRFSTRENSASAPVLCLEVCPSAACVFTDGFESGNTTGWSTTTP